MRDLGRFYSDGVRIQLRKLVMDNPSLIGTTQTVPVLAGADIDSAFKGQIDLSVPETNRKVSDRQIGWMKTLSEEGVMKEAFNTGLFTFGASSRPETSGLGVALVGSLYMMLIVLGLSLPIGVAASIYLEEFAKKNRFTDMIEVNINNLAAVPSIVFGLLGLAVFINFFGLPRSASLVGGLVLTLMTLPTIIIATRAALRAVPPSIRAAALGLGASKTQMVFHHVLPLAAPGILTGTIIGLAHALGETAPLLLIGMVAFVADVPSTPMDPSTALPVQIYMWANEAERAFVERTSGAIIVLLLFLAVMNIAAIILRRRFERRW
jgi:phosphate transport system permease protein